MQPPRRLLALAALPFVLLLPGCERPPPPVPPEAWRCLPRPQIPVEIESDGQLAVLLVDAFEYGDDCAARLALVQRILSAQPR